MSDDIGLVVNMKGDINERRGLSSFLDACTRIYIPLSRLLVSWAVLALLPLLNCLIDQFHRCHWRPTLDLGSRPWSAPLNKLKWSRYSEYHNTRATSYHHDHDHSNFYRLSKRPSTQMMQKAAATTRNFLQSSLANPVVNSALAHDDQQMPTSIHVFDNQMPTSIHVFGPQNNDNQAQDWR